MPTIPGTQVLIPEALVPLLVPIDSVRPDPLNPRVTKNLPALIAALREFGFTDPIVVQADTGLIEAGHQRHLALTELGATHVPAVSIDHSVGQARRFALVHNRASEVVAEWDVPGLAGIVAQLKLEDDALVLPGWGEAELAELLRPDPPDTGRRGRLRELFVMPPFSVLDARAGVWADRKRSWLDTGIAPPMEPAGNVVHSKDWVGRRGSDGTVSVFDPVLAELVVRWFSAPGGVVLDPFAGGPVRGLVAGALGRSYRGIDLRADQVANNRAQWMSIGRALRAVAIAADDPGANSPAPAPIEPTWTHGDSTDPAVVDAAAGAGDAIDLVFSCPPYGDLEEYSDDAADISTMPHADFLSAHARSIAHAVARLRDDRFAAWVVGDFRGPDGLLRDFVSATIAAFRAAGAHLYNEAVLATPIGSAVLRANRTFGSTRKLVKVHQQLLVFVKGDPRRAAAYAIGTSR